MNNQNHSQLIEQILLFTGLGALTWAIRGTDGWGGFDGAILPGMIWAILMYSYLKANNIASGWACFLFGLGISIGGMWGYGVYISFINHRFLISTTESISINPWIGYLWLFITGCDWGGPAAVFFCWSIWKATLSQWLQRIIIPIIFCVIFLIFHFLIPELIYPFYTSEFYQDPNCISCSRSLGTNFVNGLVFFWLIGAIFTEFLLKNNNQAKMISFVAIAFGLAFMISAAWCVLYEYSNFTDWWKVWELTMGFFAGLIVFLFLQLYLKFSAGMLQKSIKPTTSGQHLSIFSFFVVLIYGSTSRLGQLLQIYPEDFSQYDMPPIRIAILSLLLFPFCIIFILKLKHGEIQINENFKIQTAFFIGLIGIITIWPSNLVIIYFILFWLSVGPILSRKFTRLN